MKLGQNVCLYKIFDGFKMGHAGSKSRSLGQILGKPFINSRGHIFCLVLMKFGQNICFDDFFDKFENGSY